jgi:hypothetical protein
MKIIGTTENGYLIDATKSEIAHLSGYYSQFDDKIKDKVKVGADINISKMFNQLYDLSSNQKRLKGTISTLRNLADLLEPVCPIIEDSIKNAVGGTEEKK